MRKPYDKDWKYTFGRMYVDSSVRSVFSDIKSIGKENIPSDGAVLVAPNHCNTLMDARVILQDSKEGTHSGNRSLRRYYASLRYSPSLGFGTAPRRFCATGRLWTRWWNASRAG